MNAAGPSIGRQLSPNPIAFSFAITAFLVKAGFLNARSQKFEFGWQLAASMKPAQARLICILLSWHARISRT